MLSTDHQRATITSIDLLKTLAVITMLIDHVGYYLLPDFEVLRVIGRASFPIWLFLIGFAKTRDLGPRLIIGCIIVQLIGIVAGLDLLPVNILGTILLVRLTLDRLAHKIFSHDDELMIGVAILTILILPTYFICEYGSAAWIVALIGYAVRNHQDIASRLGRPMLVIFMLASIAAVVASQIFTFGFEGVQAALAAAVIVLSIGFSVALAPKGDLAGSRALPAWILKFFQFCGSRTLEIYVVHLLILRPLAAYYGIGEFGWFAGGLSPLD